MPPPRNGPTRTTWPDARCRPTTSRACRPHSATTAAAIAGGSVSAASLQAIDDPLSRLIAVALLFRAGKASPEMITLAADTASSQGWRRPLLAWLQVQALRAERAGAADEAAAAAAPHRAGAGRPVAMPATPWFSVDVAAGRTTLRLAGAWRLSQLADIEAALTGLALPADATVDGSALAAIDSAAALVLLRALQARGG